MGYSMKDLENAAKDLQNRLDAIVEEKGKRLADSLIGTTRGVVCGFCFCGLSALLSFSISALFAR
jgi:hypothetical protein